jgi:uncharacterized membrane protein
VSGSYRYFFLNNKQRIVKLKNGKSKAIWFTTTNYKIFPWFALVYFPGEIIYDTYQFKTPMKDNYFTVSISLASIMLCFCFIVSSSCVPYVASFSGFSFLIAPSIFSNVHISLKLRWRIIILQFLFHLQAQ